jgi:hypothetical protein
MLALQHMTAKEVKEAAPDLVASILDEFGGTVREAAAPQSSDVEKLVRENATLTARLDEMEAERNREQTRLFVDKTIRESGSLSDAQVAYLARGFEGATVGDKGSYPTPDALATAVRETAAAYVATLPQPGSSGEISGLGGRTGSAEGTSGYVNPMDLGRALSDGLALSIWGRDVLPPKQVEG